MADKRDPRLAKTDLGFVPDNHRKFDRLREELMGSEVHLHDLTDQTDRTIDRIDNSLGKPNISTQKNLNQPKFDDFFSQVASSSKTEKLYKENVDLQKKNMALQAENQAKKQKAELWDRIRKYIVQRIHPLLELGSVRYSSSDAALINQFCSTVEQMAIHHTKKNLGSDHALCQETIEQLKKKLERERQQNSVSMTEKQKLVQENRLLAEKIALVREHRSNRYSHIEETLQSRFIVIQEHLEQKKRQNDHLREKIHSLQDQILISQREDSSTGKKKPVEHYDMGRSNYTDVLQEENKTLKLKIRELQEKYRKTKKSLLHAQQVVDQYMKKVSEAVKQPLTQHIPEIHSGFAPNSKLKIIKSFSHKTLLINTQINERGSSEHQE